MRPIIFLDNAKIHKAASIKKLFASNKSIALFNCPYSPEINFCEEFIKIHKQRLKIAFEHLR